MTRHRLCGPSRRPAATVLAALLAGSAGAAQPPSELAREPCHVEGIRALATCARLSVPADRAAPAGSTLSVGFAVLPPSGGEVELPPLYMLAGGPGQAASDLGLLVGALRGVREGREVVLVDQRGTGRSSPFACKTEELSADASGEALAAACATDPPGDPAHFTTADFVADLEAVRAALGHEEVDLWGGSYGTRAALLYADAHPDRVRAMVLDGVAPPQLPLFAREAGTFGDALRATFRACGEDEACRAAFGDVAGTFAELRERLDADPASVASTARDDVLVVTGDRFADGLRAALYFSEGASMIPLVVARAATGDFRPWAALAELGAMEGVNPGLFLSVQCAEEAPQVEAADAGADAFFAGAFETTLRDACAAWPAAPLPEGFGEPVVVRTPTLLLSGALDPVTPPAAAEAALSTLPNAVHFVAPGAAHGVTGFGCAPELVEAFLRDPDPDGLDGACLSEIDRPPFATGAAGPRP